MFKNKSFIAKDNFWTKKFYVSASSFFLEDFFPNEDATVIKLLKKRGFICKKKANLDELSCGDSGLLSKNGIIVNPYKNDHISGGSSSESSFMVSKKIVDFSIATDTGGSIRCPSSYCGVIGFKPSYGLISRYGLLPLASSLDTVGIISSELKIIKKIFSIISKEDYKDLNTLNRENFSLKKNSEKKITIIENLEKYLNKELKEKYFCILKELKKKKYLIKKKRIPKIIKENIKISYLAISSSELLSHLNSLQGITFGIKEKKTIKKKRSNYLGKEVKKRLLIGSFFLEKKNHEIFEKLKKIRKIIQNWIKKIFENSSYLIFPTMNDSAPKIKEINKSFEETKFDHWSNDLILLANFSGIPSLSLPFGTNTINSLPFGICINSFYKRDKNLLNFSKKLEKIIFNLSN